MLNNVWLGFCFIHWDFIGLDMNMESDPGAARQLIMEDYFYWLIFNFFYHPQVYDDVVRCCKVFIPYVGTNH